MYLEQLSKIAAQFEEFDLILYQAGGYQVPVSKMVALHVATMEECVRGYGVG